MKKTKVALALCLCLCLLLGGCGGGDVPEGFDRAEVLARAEEVVSLLSAGDYEGVVAQFNDDMAAALDAERLEAALGAALDSLGAFQEVKSEKTGDGKDASGGSYAVAVLTCAYEKGRATYTVSVDAEGRICGLYMK